MPIFEFECSECGETFEELVRSAAVVDEVVCPCCGGKHVQKKISTFASKISGSNFVSSYSSSSAGCSTGSL